MSARARQEKRPAAPTFVDADPRRKVSACDVVLRLGVAVRRRDDNDAAHVERRRPAQRLRDADA